MCPNCEAYRKQLLDLQVELRRLRQMVHDMGGEAMKLIDDPYEDEHNPAWEKDELPKVPWGDDR